MLHLAALILTISQCDHSIKHKRLLPCNQNAGQQPFCVTDIQQQGKAKAEINPYKTKSPQKNLWRLCGGKKGIRTLEGFMGPTRFPVVRLRPAQPSFHLFGWSPHLTTCYIIASTFWIVKGVFEVFLIFLQKNPGWGKSPGQGGIKPVLRNTVDKKITYLLCQKPHLCKTFVHTDEN